MYSCTSRLCQRFVNIYTATVPLPDIKLESITFGSNPLGKQREPAPAARLVRLRPRREYCPVLFDLKPFQAIRLVACPLRLDKRILSANIRG